MEGEKKNSTALLTVIAIATLLVAVVGATFAYFSASATNSSNVTVTANTKGSDQFQATGGNPITLTVTGATMQQEAGNDNYSVTGDSQSDNHIVVSLKSGSGTATCTYDLVYVPSTTYTATQSSLVEFGMLGTSTDTNHKFGYGANDVKAPVNVSGAGSTLTGTDNEVGHVLYSTSITNTANSDASQAATSETWTITAEYYNLSTVDQSSKAGISFGGVVKVANVDCTNS